VHITNHQASVGAAVVHANAVSLLQAARHLRERQLYGHATALAILSAEESSKALVLLGHVTLEQDPSVLHDVFVKHAIKLSIAERNSETIRSLIGSTGLFPDLADGHPTSTRISDLIGKWGPKANSLKQAGFYVSFAAGNWQSPQEALKEDCDISFFVAAAGIASVGSQLPKLAS
jgi:AbiV family abortive infection protein